MPAYPEAFRAYVVNRDGDRFERGLRSLVLADLPEGDVEIRVEWSSVNYKDGLAATADETRVLDRAIQPRPERLRLPDVPRVAERLQQRFLHHIVTVRRPPAHRLAVAPRNHLRLSQEVLDGRRIPRTHAVEHGGIRRCRLRTCVVALHSRTSQHPPARLRASARQALAHPWAHL